MTPSVKLSSSPAELLQQGPLIDILISATRFELDEGRAVGLDFPDWKVRALIDTGALCNNYQPANWQNLQTSTDQPRKNCSGWWRSGRVSGACGSNIISGIASASFDGVRVVACPIIRRPFFSCLIGRDILQRFRLIYDGRNGEVEIQA